MRATQMMLRDCCSIHSSHNKLAVTYGAKDMLHINIATFPTSEALHV